MGFTVRDFSLLLITLFTLKSGAVRLCCTIDHRDASVVVRLRKYMKYSLCLTLDIFVNAHTQQLFSKLQPSLSSQIALQDFLPKSSPPLSTSFTSTKSSTLNSNGGSMPITTVVPEIYTTSAGVPMPNLRSDRPALLVSSTSWTPDEDFSILIEALGLYEKRATKLASLQSASHGRLPKLLVILTGKGSLKEKYMGEVGKLQKSWKWVQCISLWLEAEDYPILLGWLIFFVCVFNFFINLLNDHRICRPWCLLAFEQLRA